MAKRPENKKPEENTEAENENPTQSEENDESGPESQGEEDMGEPTPEPKGKKGSKSPVDITGGARQNQVKTEQDEKIDGMINSMNKKLEDTLAEIKGLFSEKEKQAKNRPEGKTDKTPKVKKEPRRDIWGFKYEWDKDSD